MAGGRGELLRLAELLRRGYPTHTEELTRTEKRLLEAEAKILLGCGSLEKLNQLVRAEEYWEQALALLRKRGVALNARLVERLLEQKWVVVLAAGTLTMTQAVQCVVADPLEEILLAGTTKTIKQAKKAIVAERRARQARKRPTRPTIFATELMGMKVSEEAVVPDAVTARRRFAALLRQTNKVRGVRAEQVVADRVGGRRVSGSGSGTEKGDVRAGGARYEVKLARTRWTVPLHQLEQVWTRSGEPGAVLLDETGPVLALVPSSEEHELVLKTRRLPRDAKYVTFTCDTYRRLLSEQPDGVVLIEWRLGTWVLGLFERLIPGAAKSRRPVRR
jgi:hypothetical protein